MSKSMQEGKIIKGLQKTREKGTSVTRQNSLPFIFMVGPITLEKSKELLITLLGIFKHL